METFLLGDFDGDLVGEDLFGEDVLGEDLVGEDLVGDTRPTLLIELIFLVPPREATAIGK